MHQQRHDPGIPGILIFFNRRQRGGVRKIFVRSERVVIHAFPPDRIDQNDRRLPEPLREFGIVGEFDRQRLRLGFHPFPIKIGGILPISAEPSQNNVVINLRGVSDKMAEYRLKNRFANHMRIDHLGSK
ncbi:hypothetical protein SDC9_167867 [bioreactor metagenome]|uniref:Uncharacterized protein n=1 Tax=bioreactor metagenome TaxID=1076179 RepID=A0A645G0X8_9ZZZZ